MQGNVQFQPVYFQPVPYDVATSVNGEEQQPFIQPEGEKKCFFQRLCKRWRNRKCARKCGAVVDDGRALGNLNNFIAGLLFGTFSPFFSLLCVFGFETKKLTRTGALFGNANFFFLLAFSLIALRAGSFVAYHGHHGHGVHPFMPFDNNTISNSTEMLHNATDLAVPQGNPEGVPQGAPYQVRHEAEKSDSSESNSHDADDDKEEHAQKQKHHGGHRKHGKKDGFRKEWHKKEHGQRKRGCKMFKMAVGASLIAGFVLLIISVKNFKRFMAIYRIRENKPESETVKVVSEAGNCRGFFFWSPCFLDLAYGWNCSRSHHQKKDSYQQIRSSSWIGSLLRGSRCYGSFPWYSTFCCSQRVVVDPNHLCSLQESYSICKST